MGAGETNLKNVITAVSSGQIQHRSIVAAKRKSCAYKRRKGSTALRSCNNSERKNRQAIH